jgi:hypothetical protein
MPRNSGAFRLFQRHAAMKEVFSALRPTKLQELKAALKTIGKWADTLGRV